jgi:unsaturated chondroitin disaccharide hydrolase
MKALILVTAILSAAPASQALLAPVTAADLNSDGIVDWRDLALFSSEWPLTEPTLKADLDLSSRVDANDFAVFASDWQLSADTGLIGCWGFEEGAGSTTADDSNNGNTGRLIGPAAWTTAGRSDNAIVFDGNTAAVELSTAQMDANAGTLSLWVYPLAFTGMPQYLFGHTSADTWTDRIQLFLNDSTGSLNLGLGDSHWTRADIAPLEKNKWHHVVLTWDHGTYSVFVNGVLRATGSYTALTQFASFADIGNDGNTLYRNESFDGIIDEVRLYNRAVSAPESDRLYLQDLDEKAADALAFSLDRLADTAATITTSQYPFYSVNYTSWYTTAARAWASGFYPSSLWLAYEHTTDPNFLTWATDWTTGLEAQATTCETEDLGFIIFNTFGKGFQLLGTPHYKSVVLDAADTVAALYSPVVGLITANWGSWQYPVNIDSMMAVELLFWSAKNGGDLAHYDIAVDHTNNIARHYIRPDGSCYNFADFNETTGELINYVVAGAHSTSTTWSRGQAWGLYGFTVAYRETNDANYLDAAQLIADYYINSVPVDSIPYWDFNAPGIPDTPRDSSAAAIAVSALLELSTLTSDPALADGYRLAAQRGLLSLTTPADMGGCLAIDSVTGLPTSPGILIEGCKGFDNIYDESLVWGDYYLIEALLRYNALNNAP